MKAQFNLQINRDNNSKKGKNSIKLASISHLSHLIPAKSSKEVNEISKFFKKNTENKEKKLYAQALSFSSNTARKTLKIKEVFPKLQNKKIKNIQKIISSENKTKPRLNMTMKKPSRKQVTVSVNSENTRKFMKDVSSHIANINRTLKNIKLDIAADFI